MLEKIDTKKIGVIAGPLFFLSVFLLIPEEIMPAPARDVAAIAALMAVLWMTEALPIAVTALLPIVLFPLMGVMNIGDSTSNYAHKLVFLFLGGFWIAAALEHSGAHRRIALVVLQFVGNRMDRVVLGFMSATAFLSMWLNNTATTMMMLPIAMAVIGRASETDASFGRCLMLGIAYAASIGGVATLIGTPPNAVLAGVAENTLGISIPFWKWMLFGLPVSIIMFAICWWYLTDLSNSLQQRHLGDATSKLLKQELVEIGIVSSHERRVIWVFAAVACLWLFKGIPPIHWLNNLEDSIVAICGALALFVIPTGNQKGEFLLDWETARQIPWDILILFGGGFALANGFQVSGLTEWIGIKLEFLEPMHWLIVIGTITLTTIFLTEITSNTATASMLLPLVAGIAQGLDQNALVPMVAAALAASYAFMLPVATPPNAIVFASRQIRIGEMVRAGIWMNLIGVLIITLSVYFLIPLVW